MTSSTPAYYSDGNTTLYQVAIPVPLPVRKPTTAERQALGAAPSGTPYPHAPFLKAADENLEVHYIITNVDDAPHAVWLLIDPWNEFVRWEPGVTVVSDEETLPNEGYDHLLSIPPKQRVEGTITSDDMQEVAVKLASVEKLLASAQAMTPMSTTTAMSAMDSSLQTTTLANHIFDYHNRSNSGDPLYTPWIPPVIAGLTGFDLGLRTEEQANVAVEVTVDVIDLNGNRFVAQDSTDTKIGLPPKVLSPPSARF